MNQKFWIAISIALATSSCSPLKSSPNDEKHQLELTLHEVQTSLDDLRHDINCFQTELQILDGRIKYSENTLSQLKHQDLEEQQAKIENLLIQVEQLEKKWIALDSSRKEDALELSELASHANETNAAFAQFKMRITDLEKDLHAQSSKFAEIGKLKNHIQTLVQNYQSNYKLYRVRPGDSLEKIARLHKTNVDSIKKANDLHQDLIMIGKELKIPLD